MLQSPTWTVCWLFSHFGWSAGLTFAAAVWKSFNIRSDFSEWFVKGFECTQGGVGVLWLTQTHAAAQMWSADPRFTLPLCVRCLEERQITAQLCRHKKQGIYNTKPHATCKLHLHSMAQHTNMQPCSTGCIQVRGATCGPADLDLTWMIDV